MCHQLRLILPAFVGLVGVHFMGCLHVFLFLFEM